MPRVLVVCLFALLPCLFPCRANAGIIAHVDISQQRLHLYVNGAKHGTWPVSTARGRYRTPTGTFRPYWLSRHHRSSLYRGAPMPWSVFFRGHYAIHGTYAVKQLGRPASHGCIRLHPSNAAVLFGLIQRHGFANTVIRITP